MTPQNETDPTQPVRLDREFLQLLACPLCKEPLDQVGTSLVCRAGNCARRFPIVDGLPMLRPDGAEQSASR